MGGERVSSEIIYYLNPQFKKDISFIIKNLVKKGLEKYEILFYKKFSTRTQLFFIYYTIVQYHDVLTDKEFERISKCSGITMKIERERLLQMKVCNSTEEERNFQNLLGKKAGLTDEQRNIYIKAEFIKEYMAILRKLLVKSSSDQIIKLLVQPGITKSYQKEIVEIYKLDSHGWNKDKTYLLDPLVSLDKLIEYRHCIKVKIPDKILESWKTLSANGIRNNRFEYLKEKKT